MSQSARRHGPQPGCSSLAADSLPFSAQRSVMPHSRRRQAVQDGGRTLRSVTRPPRRAVGVGRGAGSAMSLPRPVPPLRYVPWRGSYPGRVFAVLCRCERLAILGESCFPRDFRAASPWPMRSGLPRQVTTIVGVPRFVNCLLEAQCRRTRRRPNRLTEVAERGCATRTPIGGAI
jgi:hypothetical protein